jgi:hypothetical protein
MAANPRDFGHVSCFPTDPGDAPQVSDQPVSVSRPVLSDHGDYDNRPPSSSLLAGRLGFAADPNEISLNTLCVWANNEAQRIYH